MHKSILTWTNLQNSEVRGKKLPLDDQEGHLKQSTQE